MTFLCWTASEQWSVRMWRYCLPCHAGFFYSSFKSQQFRKCKLKQCNIVNPFCLLPECALALVSFLISIYQRLAEELVQRHRRQSIIHCSGSFLPSISTAVMLFIAFTPDSKTKKCDSLLYIVGNKYYFRHLFHRRYFSLKTFFQQQLRTIQSIYLCYDILKIGTIE